MYCFFTLVWFANMVVYTDYCHLRDIKFNAKTSVCLFFKYSVNKRCALPKFFNRDTICEFSNEVMISSSMRTTTDVKRQTRVCTSQLVNS